MTITEGTTNRFFLIFLCLICAAVYLNCLDNGFVLDDENLIVHNPLIKSGQLSNLIFKTGLYEYSDTGRQDITYDKMYRPIQNLSYALDYKIWGECSFGFHLTNILIHMLNSILIYFLFSMLLDKNIAVVTSAFFALHPIQASSVTYISGRADLLVSLFVLLSIISFLKYNRGGPFLFYMLSLFAATLALLCRENALFLFLFILLVLFFSAKPSKIFILLIPFLLLDLFYLGLRFMIFGYHGLTSHPVFISLPIRIANFLNCIPRYVALLLLPLNLHLVRTTNFITSILDKRFFFTIGFILLCIYFLKRSKKRRVYLFSASWFLIAIFPVFFL
jgi:hypothetical protein